MPIIGFNFDKVTSERKSIINGPIKAKTDVTIKQVTKEVIPTSNQKKDEVLKFNFEFKVDYEPKIGTILIEGYILFSERAQMLQKILETWGKEKKMDTSLMAQLVNLILLRCTVKALILAQDVNLPPHMRLPSVSPKIKVEDYIG